MAILQTEPTGTTFWDVLLRLAKFKTAWVLFGGLILAVLGLLLSGTLDITFDGGALKVSRSASGQPVVISGDWTADGKDIPGVIDNMLEPYQYDMEMHIDQKGARVYVDGTYVIKGHPEDPRRHITGKATLDGEYLSWTYETSINNGASVTHGVMLLKIYPSLREASGYYIGRSLKNDGGVFGSIRLHKQTAN